MLASHNRVDSTFWGKRCVDSLVRSTDLLKVEQVELQPVGGEAGTLPLPGAPGRSRAFP